jgi:hypothetical protein
MTEHRLVHLAGEARCSCGWKPTSSRRQVASVHQHATRESQKKYARQRACAHRVRSFSGTGECLDCGAWLVAGQVQA